VNCSIAAKLRASSAAMAAAIPRRFNASLPRGPSANAFMAALAAARRSSTRTRAAQSQLDGGQESDRTGSHNHNIGLFLHSIFRILDANMYSVHT
jgi:hypothetical protein